MAISNQNQDLEDNLDERDKRLTVLQEQHKLQDMQDKNNSRFINPDDKQQNISQHQKNNKSNDNIKSESGLKNQRKIEFKDQSVVRMETSMNQTKADEDSERDSYNTNKQ
ncbi:hypothetical protein PPERSA_05571 [Pseudocohnilembus persalinus]|uniref:Uncharacterized protein n=1 Tax=Pseudocohnilembus persalinus TaxID=266149 RepID=A0A0V0Q7K8_PSEPJ|nr:hypothetical protein PPERSA_05571 [Pseudocohnilembus persalinus]|eukprot:KRW98227.1 hypothetical protein PPERSA_05571 [Pseudocohnilembus persalinus]